MKLANSSCKRRLAGETSLMDVYLYRGKMRFLKHKLHFYEYLARPNYDQCVPKYFMIREQIALI